MAAVTVASQSGLEVMGHSKVKHYLVTAPADAATLTVEGMTSIKSVQHANAAVAAAADCYGVDVSGNVITFQLTGTAVDQWVTVFGL